MLQHVVLGICHLIDVVVPDITTTMPILLVLVYYYYYNYTI